MRRMRVTAGRLPQVEKLPLMMTMMRKNEGHNLMLLSLEFESTVVF